MARAYVNALLSQLSRDSIVGIYAKGSAYRRWDSVIDYVPELSDVDIHVRVRDDDGQTTLRTLGPALDVAERALKTFSALHPSATHQPRPQLIPVSEIEGLSGFRPAPAGTVHTLFGEPDPGADREQYAGVAPEDRARFVLDADFVARELPLKVIDRPGARAWSTVSRLTFRVGSTGPRLLTQLGMDPYDAWSLNRTSVVDALCTLEHSDLAEAYADFYLAGWDGYRSGFRDSDAARRALLAADRLFRLGRGHIAEDSAPSEPEGLAQDAASTARS